MAGFRTSLAAALLTLVASNTLAQERANPWARGTELGIAASTATSASDSGPMFATAAGWEVTQWVAVEGRGSWFIKNRDARAFAVDLNALVNLVAKRDVTPYVGGGVGFYRATFDSTAAASPGFYRNRLENRGLARAVSFTDPSFHLTAGIDFIVRRYLTVRPEASAWIVRRGGAGVETYSLGVRVGYRFEDHPITKSRAAR